jgi:uncharacterized delta-60 repeat protein
MLIRTLCTCGLLLGGLQFLRGAPGDVDGSFASSADREVTAVAVQPDGKIVIGGAFGTVNGVTRNRLARLNGNGSLDTTFNPGPNGSVYCVAAQTDGAVVVGGDFTSLGVYVRSRIARISAGGTVDGVFDPGANGIVRAIAVQNDGKIVIGGDFTQIGTVTRNRLARLNPDGSLDTSFDPNVNETVYSIALQADGRIVIAGSFTTVGNARRNHVARLTPVGTVDGSFNVNVGTGLFTAVYCTAVQADGKVLIGGSFTNVGNAARNRLARINANGTLDGAFAPDVDSWVNSMAVQADGRIVIAGLFGNVNGAVRRHVARLTVGGAVDAGFVAHTDDHVYGLALQGDGAVLIAGLFETAAGAARSRVARIENNAAVETLTAVTANQVRWLRGGTAPETHAVVFSVSGNNGVTWTELGSGQRIPGGWQFNGGAVPVNGLLRARARTSGGFGNGSGGWVEKIQTISLPAVVTQPASDVMVTSVTLNGTVNARGVDRDVVFEYGTTTAYGSTVAAAPPVVSGDVVTPVSAMVSGLLPHTRYHFRALAGSAMGGSAGANGSFVTSNRLPTPVDDSAVVLPGAVVTLLVTANDVDADGDALTITAFTQPPATAGKVARSGSALVFTATAGFTGADFTYTVSDGFGGTATAAVALTLGNSTIDPATVNIASEGVTYPVDVAANGFWSAAETLPWVTVVPVSGAGGGTVQVTVLPNEAKAARSGTVTIAGKTHTINQAGVLLPALAPPPVVPDAIVSGAFSLTVPTLNFPVKYTVTKMPPGLSINHATGLISGQPTAAGTYDLTVKAANAAGTSNTITFTILVAALDANVVGTYHGIIGNHADINGNLGSRFELTTTGKGTYTGKIISGAVTRAFAGSLIITLADPLHPRCLVTLPRAGTTALTLDVVLDGTANRFGGTLTDGAATLPVAAWRNVWSAANKASAFRTLHTFCLEQSNPDAGLPWGHGYGSFTVAENTGVMTVAGRLADGNAVTTATFVGPQGEVILYQSLYGGRGSFHGVLTVTAGATPADNTLAGGGIWFKLPSLPVSTETVFRAGFAPTAIGIDGAAYATPAPGAVVLGLPNVGDNARLSFTGGGLEDEVKEFSMDFSLLNPSATGLTSIATFPAANPNRVSLKVNSATGIFTGAFTLLDATPTLNRTVLLQGQIVKRPGGAQGCGFALLPKLPVPPETTANSPKRSVRIELGAK